MAGGKESALGQSHRCTVWFEAFGSRGFAFLGASLGFALSLLLIWATAPPLPAAAARPKGSPVVQAEKPTAEDATPSVAVKQGFLASPQPLVSPPRAETSLATSSSPSAVPVTTPRPLLSTPAAERSDSETTSRSSTSNGASDASSGTGGGTVNVRGYYRKNGTYVAPHTRRARGGRR
jgi:hypothetical protein